MNIFNNASLANVVVSVVLSFLQKKKSFSAWEVTNEVRSLYPSYCVLNSSVRPMVHDLFNQGFFSGYDRFDNGNFIQYRPQGLNSLASQSLAPVAPVSLMNLISKSGNVRLPVSVTRKLALSPGDKVNVTVNGVTKVFTVDVYGNVKITAPKDKTYAVIATQKGLELKVV